MFNKRCCHIVLVYCLFAMNLQAQEEFIEPPSQRLVSVPFFQLTGGIVILQARFADFPDTLNFILDSGSSGISLDSSTVDYFGLSPVASDKSIRGIAGIKKVSFLYDQTLHFPGISIDHLNFHVNDYDILTAVYGERIDGIIGYSVLSRYIMKLDYDSMQLTFFSKGNFRYPKGGFLLKPSIGQLAAQDLRVKDARTINARFLYDMGAGLNLLLSKEFAEDSAVLYKKRKRWIKQGEGLGGKIDMELTVMKEIKVGPYKFRNVPVYIFDDEFNVSSYPYMCGILGNDLLRRFNVYLNYEKSEFYLLPNTHFNEVFDYSYSGVELYLVGGRIIVGDIAIGSAAEAVGLKEGDEVIAINKNFSQNLNQYKIALQVPNEKVKIIIRRNAVMMEFEFKVNSIR